MEETRNWPIWLAYLIRLANWTTLLSGSPLSAMRFLMGLLLLLLLFILTVNGGLTVGSCTAPRHNAQITDITQNFR
jgi:hypothetical protein